MARRATGTIIEHTGTDGLTYRSLRFTAYGKRRYVALGAVGREDAERQLRGTLADVERGIWKEPRSPAPEPQGVPTFHEFAELWWVEREREWRDRTRIRYRECLELHLLPFFGETPVDRITIADVDRYKAARLRDGKIAPATINKQLVLLSSILEAAEERELVPRNVARGRRRRVKATKPRRSYLDTAEQITALLDAAAQLDNEARSDRRHVHRMALLATLTFAGLRLGELLDLRWRDVDLAVGRLRVGEAKTEAGVRDVTIRAALRDVLVSVKMASNADRDSYVFGTSDGKRQGATNVRKRVLVPAIERADELLAERRANPLRDGLTPHSLRRTFASVLYAIGEDPPTVMAEMGHSSPALALAIYAQAMRRDEGENARLRAVVEGVLTDSSEAHTLRRRDGVLVQDRNGLSS
jgi:integrase